MGWKFSSSCHIDSSFSVKKKTLPLCSPHRKKGPRIITAGPQHTDPRSAARSAEVSPAASGLSEGFQNSSINSTGTSLLCAEHEVAPCVKSIWAENREFILQSKAFFHPFLDDVCDVYVCCFPYCWTIS